MTLQHLHISHMGCLKAPSFHVQDTQIEKSHTCHVSLAPWALQGVLKLALWSAAENFSGPSAPRLAEWHSSRVVEESQRQDPEKRDGQKVTKKEKDKNGAGENNTAHSCFLEYSASTLKKTITLRSKSNGSGQNFYGCKSKKVPRTVAFGHTKDFFMSSMHTCSMSRGLL